MTILSKILNRATFIAKNEISSMDMSAVVKNDNFEQNLGSSHIYCKK